MKEILYKQHPEHNELFISSKGVIIRKHDTHMNVLKPQGVGHNRMYKRIQYKGVYYYIHILVYQTWVQESWDEEEYEIDHIDGDPSNNKLNNLRLLTIRENRQNVTLRFKPIKITNIKTGEVIYAKSGIHAAELLNTQKYYVSNALTQKKSILSKTYKLEYADRIEAEEYFNKKEGK